MDGQGFEALVRTSRSCRRFGGDEVGEGVLRELVAAARLAPTGNNTQQLRFRLVSGPEACAGVFAHLRWAAALTDWAGPEPDERPGGYVVICLPAAAAANEVRHMDVGIAAQTMALAATSRGLGACLVKSFDAGLAGELALPGGLVPALVVAVGPRAETVVLEEAGSTAAAPHGLAYWREADGTHHVPKLPLDELVV